MKYIITGSAGFIGFHLSRRLLEAGHQVIGIDNFNDYYDVQLKEDRTLVLVKHSNYTLYRQDIADMNALEEIFKSAKADVVINLAAQAGVRYSIENPQVYVQSNLVGFANILECCRRYNIKHLVYASSSSIYGANAQIPFSEEDKTDMPVSFYGATKKANEIMAYSYSHLYGIPCTGLRFFTVYGPWGRPDMAYFLFTKAILQNSPIKVYNGGEMRRDFTYVDDIVEGIIRVSENAPVKDISGARSKVYNIGNSKPVSLELFINTIEDKLGKAAIKEYLPMQAGDMVETYADVSALMRDTGYLPDTSIDEGIGRFAAWYLSYYKIDCI